MPPNFVATGVDPDEEGLSGARSKVVRIQIFQKLGIYQRFSGTAFASVWVYQIETNPGEAQFGYCGVVKYVESSAVEAQ